MNRTRKDRIELVRDVEHEYWKPSSVGVNRACKGSRARYTHIELGFPEKKRDPSVDTATSVQKSSSVAFELDQNVCPFHFRGGLYDAMSSLIGSIKLEKIVSSTTGFFIRALCNRKGDWCGGI